MTRAGAIAEAQGRMAGEYLPPESMTRRWVGQVIGSALVALGVSLTLVSGLGVGSLDVFNIGLADAVGVPLAVAVWIVAATMIALAAALGAKPRLGTFVTPFVVGAAIQPLVDLHYSVLPEMPTLAALPVHLLGVGLIGAGAGAVVVAGFGAGTGELLTDVVARRLGRSAPLMRFGIESSWAVAGIALGGPAGIGTVLGALFIGPAVEQGVRLARPLMAAEPVPLSDTPPGSPSTIRHRRAARVADRVLVRR